MKKKDINKKLELNKETVSNLNRNEMGNVKGGSSPLCWVVGGYLTAKIANEIVDHFSDVCTVETKTGTWG